MRVIRAKELALALGISRATLWRWSRDKNFPNKIRLGDNSVGWLEIDIKAWLQERKISRLKK